MKIINNTSNSLIGPRSALEIEYIEQYLQSQGLSLEDLHSLSKVEAKRIMAKACTYTSCKLAEVESRAKFQRKIHSE